MNLLAQHSLTRLWMVICMAGLLTACAGARQQIETPRLSMVNVKFVDAGIFEQRYRVTLRIRNPNSIALPIQGVQYNLVLDGIKFADGVSAQAFEVPAYGEATFDMDVSANLLNTARHLGRVMRGEMTSLDYQMEGHVVVDLPFVGRVPFDETGNISFK